jgi:hypothetical protein
MNETWQIVEMHGAWWAYEGELPPPEAFRTHGRPPNPPILGPYPSRAVAEMLLQKQRDRRDARDARTHANASGVPRRRQW